MKSRRIRTLSSNIAMGTVSKRAPVPSPAPPAKSKRTFEVQIDDEPAANVVEIQGISYDKKKLIKDFESYSEDYFTMVLELVLRHQALRTAVSQVGNAVSKEFNNSFHLLDTETDEAIADIFKINFLTAIIDHLNEKFHPDSPLSNLEVTKLLFFTQNSPLPAKPSPGLDSKKFIEQLAKLIPKSNVGPYGINGNDKTNT